MGAHKKFLLADRSWLTKQRLIALMGYRREIQVVAQPMNSAEVISDMWNFRPDSLITDPMVTDGAARLSVKSFVAVWMRNENN